MSFLWYFQPIPPSCLFFFHKLLNTAVIRWFCERQDKLNEMFKNEMIRGSSKDVFYAYLKANCRLSFKRTEAIRVKYVTLAECISSSGSPAPLWGLNSSLLSLLWVRFRLVDSKMWTNHSHQHTGTLTSVYYNRKSGGCVGGVFLHMVSVWMKWMLEIAGIDRVRFCCLSKRFWRVMGESCHSVCMFSYRVSLHPVVLLCIYRA
jgi:hypothetical protein